MIKLGEKAMYRNSDNLAFWHAKIPYWCSHHSMLISIRILTKNTHTVTPPHLSESVDIKDGNEIAQLKVLGKGTRFPHTPFSTLSITNHTEDTVASFVNVFATVSHSTPNIEPLAKRTSGNINVGLTLENE